MNDFCIYTITSMHLSENHKGLMRCWGYYLDVNTAKQAVAENWARFFEDDMYNYTVIEAYPEGLAALATEVEWYKHDADSGGGIPTGKPDSIAHTCHFGMG